MSHFTVLILGGNVDEQLAPYDENERVEEYSNGPVSEEDLERMYNYYKEKKDFVGTLEECLEQYSEDWNEGWRKDENGVWQDYTTYNPKSKWDWYQTGGRWAGFFKLKEGATGISGDGSLVCGNQAEEGTADVLLKKDIDFEGMMNDAGKKASEYYDKIIGIIGNLPEVESWESIRERFENIDDARDFYHNQERVKALKEANEHWADPEDFQISREDYIENARLRSFVPYAVVKDGEWFQKGEMGWWGMSSNEMSQSDWNKKVSEMIMACDDETEFTLVDCHI